MSNFNYDMNIAKSSVHELRRTKRTEAFSKVDGDSVYAVLNEEGEALRVQIKEEDDLLQISIDNTRTANGLYNLAKSKGLL